MGPFCENSFCILNRIAVPDDQDEIEVAYPNGQSGNMVRVQFVDNHKSLKFCEACANAVNLVLTGEQIERPADGITVGGLALNN
jgi:hypothetical protein